MSNKFHITRKDIDSALEDTTWDIGNNVLYKLCKDHPAHEIDNIIAAKIWLIGRSYSAAIERRRDISDNLSGDKFYHKKVIPLIRKHNVDDWFYSVFTSDENDIATILNVHKKLTDLFRKISGIEKRSLASKYLHFHFPDIYYMYDSRAKNAVYKLTKSFKMPHFGSVDKEYMHFYYRCKSLKNSLSTVYRKSLSPRDLDKILLFCDANW